MPVLPGVECLWVAADNDPTGLSHARTCVARWQPYGAETFIIIPSAPRADLNDIIMGAHNG